MPLSINTNRHHEDLDRIVAGLPEHPQPVYLRLRAVCGARDAKGVWRHEYQIEIVNPYEDEDEHDF